MASASSSAIASSCPGSQSMRIGVVTRAVLRLPRQRSAVTAAHRSGKRRAHRPRTPGGAPPRGSRPSSSETTRHAVKASPAAVPSTASTCGGFARVTSFPSSSRTAPSSPRVTRDQRLVAERPRPRSDWRPRGPRRRPSGRAGRRVDAKPLAPAARASRTASSGISSWQSTVARGGEPRPRVAFAPGTTTITFSPSSSTRMIATPVGASTCFDVQRDAGFAETGQRLAGIRVAADAADQRTSAPSLAAATAWFAPLPPGIRSSVAPLTVSPGRGSARPARRGRG